VRNGLIKQIFFDIGGVLLNIDSLRSLQYWSACTGLSVENLRDRFSTEVLEWYETGNFSDDEFFRSIQENLPRSRQMREEDFWAGWDQLILDETKTAQLLPELKQSYRLYLLSNTNHRHIHFELKKRFHFQYEVHKAFYSFELGCRKPDKEIYLKALKEVNGVPRESLFIDDMAINIEQAEKLGFKTIHYTSHERTVTLLNEMGIIAQ